MRLILILLSLLISAGGEFASATPPIKIPGDSTLSKMRLKSVYLTSHEFQLSTNGARFSYANGQLRVFQGLREPKRLILVFRFEPLDFIITELNPDHILLTSTDNKVSFAFYGDSTFLISSNEALSFTTLGYFKPDYKGNVLGEYLLIDSRGGAALYPQRHENGYTFQPDLNSTPWKVDYQLNPNTRFMLSVFPPKQFNWAESFNKEFIIVYASDGKPSKSPYGQLPPRETLHEIAKHFNIIIAWHINFYENGSPNPPYKVVNEQEYRRFIHDAHMEGLKVIIYTSFFNSVRVLRSDDSYFNLVRSLKTKYPIDGVYVDGLKFDYNNTLIEDKIGSWRMIRKLRELFGPNGIIVLHETHAGSPVAISPNIESYCDLVINGENVPFKSVKDPYVQFLVRKYHISNTLGIWLYFQAKPANIPWQDCVDEIIRMNCRLLSYSFMTIQNDQYVWQDGMTSYYSYYRPKLENLKKLHVR